LGRNQDLFQLISGIGSLIGFVLSCGRLLKKTVKVAYLKKRLK